MPTVLITGANRGLGLEFASQYARDGWRVIATYRNPDRIEALRAIGGIELHQLDVTDFKAIYALGQTLATQTIDLVIANAGTNSAKPMSPAMIDEQAWIAELRVNTMAPLALAAALREPVLRSGHGKMVALSSVHGSIQSNVSGGLYVYRSTKSALHAVWRSWAMDNPGIISAVLHPGWVQTEMGGPSADIDAATSVSGMRRVIGELSIEQSGSFFRYDGAPLPW